MKAIRERLRKAEIVKEKYGDPIDIAKFTDVKDHH